MDPQRFARLKEALLSARRLSVEKREAYIAEVSDDDAEFRAELEAILDQDSVSIDILRSLHLESIADAIQASLSRAAIPERIGPYRIAGVLGEGGMGVVYRAEQTEPIRREVALKLMRPGFDSQRIQSRFESERQTLALMDHAHIARLLDASMDEHGSPYFVMELVRGMPVTDYCRQNRVPLRLRLELFRDICRAVQHAHQKGVIHRDLKPSNLLITTQQDRPVPKIIDFGIAKVMDADVALPALTREGQLIGTLEYMSPEQAKGMPGAVDTRSDVYSLGVVLHELVTGSLPYQVRELPIPEAIRVISEATPPSTRRTSDTERLDGDLDTIIRKALEKEPSRRYQSAAAFADDLVHFLRSEPIEARPAGRGYLLRKLVVRHKTFSAAVGTIMALLLAFSVVVAVMLRREQEARRHAELESKKSTRTTEFMQEVFLASSPSEGGSQVTVREVLDAVRKKIDEGSSEEPAVEIEVRRVLAQTYIELARPLEAESQLRNALETCDRLPGDDRSVRTSVLVDLARAVEAQGRAVEAESLELAAVVLDPSRTREDQITKARVAGVYAGRRLERGDYIGADSLFAQSIERQRTVSGDHFERKVERLRGMATCRARLGRLDEGERLFREALDEARNEPAAWRAESRIAETEVALGEFLVVRGEYVEAESLLSRMSKGGQPSGAFDEPRVRARLHLGIARRCRGNWAGAESLLIQAAAEVERFPRYRSQLVTLRHELGKVLAATGRFAEAESVHVRAVADAESAPERSNVLRAIALRGLGELRVEEGRFREAEALFRGSLDCLQREERRSELDIAMTRLCLAMALMEEGQPLPAEQELRLVLIGLEEAGWSREWPAVVAANELACCLALNGQDEAADRLWEDSREELLATSSGVPVSLRSRGVAHTVNAMTATGRQELTEYRAASSQGSGTVR